MRRLMGGPPPEDAFTPNDGDGYRSKASTRMLSHLVIPEFVRNYGIVVDLETKRDVYHLGESIDIRITMRNRFPVPIQLTTQTPERWRWALDGMPEASKVPVRDPPEESTPFVFDRSERKVFLRRWTGYIRVTEDEWEPARPGTYTLSAAVNVEDPKSSGLYAEKTIELVDDDTLAGDTS